MFNFRKFIANAPASVLLVLIFRKFIANAPASVLLVLIFRKFIANATASVLLVGATYIPAAQAQGYTSFGGRYTAPIPARPVNFIGNAGDVLPRCLVFRGCTAARLIKGKVRPVSNRVVGTLEANGFKHKERKDRSFFTLQRERR